MTRQGRPSSGIPSLVSMFLRREDEPWTQAACTCPEHASRGLHGPLLLMETWRRRGGGRQEFGAGLLACKDFTSARQSLAALISEASSSRHPLLLGGPGVSPQMCAFHGARPLGLRASCCPTAPSLLCEECASHLVCTNPNEQPQDMREGHFHSLEPLGMSLDARMAGVWGRDIGKSCPGPGPLCEGGGGPETGAREATREQSTSG